MLPAADSSQSSPRPRPASKTSLGMIGYVSLFILGLLVLVVNSVAWKRTLNAYRCVDAQSCQQPSLEIFVSQMCQLLYTCFSICAVSCRLGQNDHTLPVNNSKEQQHSPLMPQTPPSHPSYPYHVPDDRHDSLVCQQGSSSSRATFQEGAVVQVIRNHATLGGADDEDSVLVKSVPQRKFVLMALMDAASTMLAALGGARVSGQAQTLINQASIPFTMICSRLFLGSLFSHGEILGAVMIALGALLAGYNDDDTSGGAATSLSSSSTMVVPVILYASSVVPASLSNIYKEVTLTTHGNHVDLYKMTTTISIYQLVFGLLYLPLLMLPGLKGSDSPHSLKTLTWSDLPNQFYQGWECFAGSDHVPGYQCGTISPLHPAVILIFYTLVNYALNIVMLQITRHGSAVLLVLLSALSLPVTSLAFSAPFLMGDAERETMTSWNLYGAVLVMCGFLCYSLAPHLGRILVLLCSCCCLKKHKPRSANARFSSYCCCCSPEDEEDDVMADVPMLPKDDPHYLPLPSFMIQGSSSGLPGIATTPPHRRSSSLDNSLDKANTPTALGPHEFFPVQVQPGTMMYLTESHYALNDELSRLGLGCSSSSVTSSSSSTALSKRHHLDYGATTPKAEAERP